MGTLDQFNLRLKLNWGYLLLVISYWSLNSMITVWNFLQVGFVNRKMASILLTNNN
jgi:hypothetical protein